MRYISGIRTVNSLLATITFDTSKFGNYAGYIISITNTDDNSIVEYNAENGIYNVEDVLGVVYKANGALLTLIAVTDYQIEVAKCLKYLGVYTDMCFGELKPLNNVKLANVTLDDNLKTLYTFTYFTEWGSYVLVYELIAKSGTQMSVTTDKSILKVDLSISHRDFNKVGHTTSSLYYKILNPKFFSILAKLKLIGG